MPRTTMRTFTRLACRVELLNHPHVHNVVELEVHPRFLACFGAGDFVVNEAW